MSRRHKEGMINPKLVAETAGLDEMLARIGLNQHPQKSSLGDALTAKQTEKMKTIAANYTLMPTDFDTLRQLLNSKARVLTLDFEFYQDDTNLQWISELAGKLYGSAQTFHYDFYSPLMSAERQLKFLREFDEPFSEIQRYEYSRVRPHLAAILRQLQPDYLVSWGNAVDFRALDREEERANIPQKKRLLAGIPRIDLADLLRDQVFDGEKTLSLEKMGKLLNIKGTEPRHVALNDVRLIDAILQFYAGDLNQEILWK